MNKPLSLGVGCLLLFGLMSPSRIDLLIHGQTLHANPPLPSFDVATIRPSKSDSLRTVRSTGELQMFDVTPRYLIEQAYNIPWTNGSKDRIRGGPGWIDSDPYDVDARIAPEAAATLEQMPEAQRRRQMNLRLQALLEDRFKLKVHFEARQQPVFAIVAVKNGPKLAPAASSAENAGPGQGISVRYNGQAAQMTAKAVTLADLANWLTGYSEMGGQTVIDQTGLAERYDFVLNWTRERASASGAENGELEAPTSGPALFTALREQLGLKLTNTRGPVEIIFIDSIERPSEN